MTPDPRSAVEWTTETVAKYDDCVAGKENNHEGTNLDVHSVALAT